REVIGINVAIFSTSGGHQGVGFAIPINMAKDVLDDLIEGRVISYGWFGVQAQEITDELAEYFNLPDKEGVLIAKVLEDSPAKKAGVKEGDIITEFDGEKLINTYDLVRRVGRTKPGKTVDVKLIRDRIRKVFKVKIGRRPSEEKVLEEARFAPEEEESKPWRGIRVSNITDEIAEQLGIKDRNGVVIIDIDSSSPFYMMGMRKGNIIREINKNLIKNISGFNKVTKEAKGKALVRTDKGYFMIEEK
ncbi:MAG: PDZ domain-containing protein, partial [Candidatus Omnitrophica bacterium]|nr:PDZ domain-containing protein [Candidatus Omnitrophota bacterium]